MRTTISQKQKQPDANHAAPLWDDTSLARLHQLPDKAQRVQAMFDSIVPRYEMVNTLTTLGLDGSWRRRLVRAMVLPDKARLLDIACGTGQVVRAFQKYRPEATEICGLDFSGPMVRQAKQIAPAEGAYFQADALHLPFADQTFDAVTCVFGLRNFADPLAGLREMFRVLRPGAMVGILEFSMPRAAVLAGLYRIYFRQILPRLATRLSGDGGGAYRYLQKSVEFFSQDVNVQEQLQQCGFTGVTAQPLTLGVVHLYTGRHP